MPSITAEIITEFSQQIDPTKEYTLKELKQILSDIYRAQISKPKIVIEVPEEDYDDDKPKKRGRPAKPRLDKYGHEKQKRAPSAYNNFVKQRINQLRTEQPTTPAKKLMKIAASSWKLLDKMEQEKYKTDM